LSRTYREFYKKSKKYKILDWGIYERETFPIENYLDLAKELSVNEIVIPDYMYDKKATLYSIEEFITITDFKKMVVPQGKDPQEWLECLAEIIRKHDGDFQVVGVPIWLNKRFGCRPHIIKLCKDGRIFDFHLLGLDDYKELLLYDKRDLVRSLDTSLPFTLAYHYKTQSVWWRKPIYYKRVSFFEKLNTKRCLEEIKRLRMMADCTA